MAELLRNIEREKTPNPTVIIKVGTNSLIDHSDNTISFRQDVFKNIASSTDFLRQQGIDVGIVTSGAVASARQIIDTDISEVEDLQALSAFGQHLLMSQWQEAFDQYNIRTGLALLTTNNLTVTEAKIRKMFRHGIPIINENDLESSEEMVTLKKSGDNDMLASHVATMLNADALIYVTNTPGVVHCEETVNVIHEGAESYVLDSLHFNGKSNGGSGGMESKFKFACEAMRNGIYTAIVPASNPDAICDSLQGKVGDYTLFVPVSYLKPLISPHTGDRLL